MKKQVVYSRFIHRLFAMMIDMLIVSFFVSVIMSFFSKHIFLYIFQDFFISHDVDMSSMAAIAEASKSEEFVQYASGSGGLTFTLLMIGIQFSLIGVYLVTLWNKFGTTPGKMAMRLKIVDANDYDKKPPLANCIKRFFAYFISFPFLLMIKFSDKGIALHDRIANTVVIKS
jgi:uncharacterized RDD family membrane protein YckC